MVFRKIPTIIFATIISGGISAQPAFAVDRLLSPGQGNTFTVSTADTFTIDLLAKHSYSCDGVPESTASEFDWNTTVSGTSGSPEIIIARRAGSISPAITGDTAGNADDNRLTFTPTTSDRFTLTVADAAGGGESVRVRCLDTTLYSGFNTNVNDFNFLELTNTTNATIAGTISATNSVGTEIISGATFSIAAGRRADIDIHTPAGDNQYGGIVLTHNGPLGSLKGGVSQYLGAVSNFELTGFVPLTPIEQAP